MLRSRYAYTSISYISKNGVFGIVTWYNLSEYLFDITESIGYHEFDSLIHEQIDTIHRKNYNSRVPLQINESLI